MLPSFPCRFILVFCLALPALRAIAGPGPVYDSIQVPVCRTSIYIGHVSMETSAFTRTKDAYEASYHAKVFPFFFLSEKGTLRIEATEAQLAQLEKGTRISFTGIATADNGEQRKIEGWAAPSTATEGNLKIRIFVSKSIKLAFPASYRFGGSQNKP